MADNLTNRYIMALNRLGRWKITYQPGGGFYVLPRLRKKIQFLKTGFNWPQQQPMAAPGCVPLFLGVGTGQVN